MNRWSLRIALAWALLFAAVQMCVADPLYTVTGNVKVPFEGINAPTAFSKYTVKAFTLELDYKGLGGTQGFSFPSPNLRDKAWIGSFKTTIYVPDNAVVKYKVSVQIEFQTSIITVTYKGATEFKNATFAPKNNRTVDLGEITVDASATAITK